MEAGRKPVDWFKSATWIDDDNADVDAYLATLKPHEVPRYDLKRKLEEWRDLGVVIFENVVDPALIKRVNDDFELVFANHRRYRVIVDGSDDVYEKYGTLDRLSASQVRDYNLRLADFHTFSHSAGLLSMVPEGVSFLTHVFGSQPALLQSLIFPRGSEQPEHQDFAFVFKQREIAKLAAFWIPLEDVHPDAGPLAYYCGSHKVSKLGFFDWGAGYINRVNLSNPADRGAAYEEFLRSRIKDLTLSPRYFLPKKGDLLIWHGALIHAGTKINNPKLTRRSFVGHFTPVTNHYLLDRNELNGGFVLDLPGADDVRLRERSMSGFVRRAKNRLKKAYWRAQSSIARRRRGQREK